MTELLIDPAMRPQAAGPVPDILHRRLIDSRQRLQHLVALASDIAFETDATGSFVFVYPDPALGWPAAELHGRPSDLLVTDHDRENGSNPFRPKEATRRLIWIKRSDGALACLAFSAVPLFDRNGQIIGSRGIGMDVSKDRAQAAQAASSLRRGELLDHILWCVGQEVMAPRMMDAALSALVNAMAGQGATVVAARADGQGEVLYETGPGSEPVRQAANRLIGEHGFEASHTVTSDRHLVLAIGCQTRFGANAGLAIWRAADSRPWDHDDITLARSAVSIIRMILEHEWIQQEMGRQARTDPLTGLLNRRAFIEEIERSAERLDQEPAPGTLMFVDMDAFKTVNDRLGHQMGDQTLIHVARMLRDLVRPSDLIARFGGDEFAIWMSGADHLTAAERADHLRSTGPAELETLLGQSIPGLGLSIGIASRRIGSQEPIRDLIHRADMAMYEVKRGGRGHWRVSLLEDH